jgi:hypothetical protein
MIIGHQNSYAVLRLHASDIQASNEATLQALKRCWLFRAYTKDP